MGRSLQLGAVTVKLVTVPYVAFTDNDPSCIDTSDPVKPGKNGSSGKFGDSKADFILNFDELSRGEILTNQYADLGIVFSATDGFPIAGELGISGDAGHLSFDNSEPNFVQIDNGALTLKFFDPDTGMQSPVSSVSFHAGDADPQVDVFGVTSFGATGDVLESQFVHLIEDGTTIRLTEGSIAEVRIFGMFGGVVIDDLVVHVK